MKFAIYHCMVIPECLDLSWVNSALSWANSTPYFAHPLFTRLSKHNATLIPFDMPNVFQTLTDTAVSFRAFQVSSREELISSQVTQIFSVQKSRRWIRTLPASTVLVAEGNCCWDVYKGRGYKVSKKQLNRKSHFKLLCLFHAVKVAAFYLWCLLPSCCLDITEWRAMTV